jgi:hypothetical protein
VSDDLRYEVVDDFQRHHGPFDHPGAVAFRRWLLAQGQRQPRVVLRDSASDRPNRPSAEGRPARPRGSSWWQVLLWFAAAAVVFAVLNAACPSSGVECNGAVVTDPYGVEHCVGGEGQ